MPMINQTKIPCFQSDYCQEIVAARIQSRLLNSLTVVDFLDDRDANEDKEIIDDSYTCDCSACAERENACVLQESPSSWSDLPSLALERIYSFLNRRDQYRMSLVCRRWSNEYKSPALWRTVKLYLKPSDTTRGLLPQVTFARKYGHLFRHVKIICSESINDEFLKDIENQLKLFLYAITSQAKLLSISFINKSYFTDFRYLNTSNCNGVCDAILHLLESQNNLRSIEFSDSFFTKFELINVLRTAFSNNAGSLRDLKLKVFNCYSALDRSCNDNQSLDLSFIQSILKLDVFEADYTRFFEMIILGLLKHADETESAVGQLRNENLKRIKLLCDRNVSHHFCFGCVGISSTAWKYLRKTCPEVKVDLQIKTGFFYKEITQFVIVPGMPLRALELELKPYSEESLCFLFQHLIKTGVSEYLEELCISWAYRHTDLASDLIEFLPACSKLRVLKLNIPHPVFGISAVLDFLFKNAPRTLEVFNICINQICSDEYSTFYKGAVDYYLALFQASNLHLSVSVETKLFIFP